MSKIWQSQSTPSLHPLIEKYTVGQDKNHDQKLLGYDIQASQAHANMLASTGLISDNEASKLTSALESLLNAWDKGEFTIPEDAEDGHSAIEALLIESNILSM